jgi:hypothetical protein
MTLVPMDGHFCMFALPLLRLRDMLTLIVCFLLGESRCCHMADKIGADKNVAEVGTRFVSVNKVEMEPL